MSAKVNPIIKTENDQMNRAISAGTLFNVNKQAYDSLERFNEIYTWRLLLGVSACRWVLDFVFLIDDCMDAGGRVMQEQFTEEKRRSSGLK